MSALPTRIAAYGEIDMNVIDGSSVWLQSVAQVLAHAGSHVTVVLRDPARRQVITAPLHAHPGVEVVDPGGALRGRTRLTPEAAAELLEQLDAERAFDVLLLRGTAVTDAILRHGRFDGRVWLYYMPALGAPATADADWLRAVVPSLHRILCQTEAIRAQLVGIVPEAAAKVVQLPPMIPSLEDPEPTRARGPVRRLFYAGKLAPEYFFLEMVELFERFRARHPDATLHVAGDKIHNPPDDPGFRGAAERALTRTEQLVWHGAVERSRVRDLLRESDIALSIRHPRMDASMELSTKILEYGAAGCPVLLNRNAIHEQLLGADYPLLASDPDEALRALERVDEAPDLRLEAARRCHRASAGHTFEAVSAGIARHLPARPPPAPSGRHLVIAGHDLKFLGDIPRWATDSGASLREDRWTQHNRHDEAASAEHLAWADTVLCEWCLGNAAWYSRAKRPHQRLVIRFHRMELETHYPRDVDLDRVDAVVFVGRHMLELAAQRFGWPASKLHVVPNAIDTDGLALPKLPGAEFNLALIGYVPARKRLDRTLDILERLRARDRRYRLIVKGYAPWELGWMRQREEERRHYEDVYARIASSPLLREAVTFEPFGDDVAAFLQKAGYILSTSDSEGHQVALGEGMASGAVPVVLERPGATEQYGDRWVHPDADRAANWILELTARDEHLAERERSRAFAMRWAPSELAPVWKELLALEGGAGAYSSS